jgi:hypothetical protein
MKTLFKKKLSEITFEYPAHKCPTYVLSIKSISRGYYMELKLNLKKKQQRMFPKAKFTTLFKKLTQCNLSIGYSTIKI